MANRTSPGVPVHQLPNASHPISGVQTSICGFVGYTVSGTDNEAQLIFSFADYTRLYGGLASNCELSYAVQQFFMNGGTQAYVVRTPGAAGNELPGTAQLVGDAALGTGIYALENVPLLNLLCIPDATRAMAGDANALDSSVALDPNAVFAAGLSFCDSKGAFLLLDCPPPVNNVAAAVQWKTSGLTVSGPNGAAFFPRLQMPDPLNNNRLRTFAPCGVVAGVYARLDATSGVAKSPAGTEATLTGVQQLACEITAAEEAALDPLAVNCFRVFPASGPVLWGARTLVGADAESSEWKYVPVRRLALFLEASLMEGTQWTVFEPNGEPLWAAIRLNVGAFLQELFTQCFFQGQTPAQAYFVKCDSETTTAADIANGVVNIEVGFAPQEPAEFVVIEIQQKAGQGS